jgi:hypothetical protein
MGIIIYQLIKESKIYRKEEDLLVNVKDVYLIQKKLWLLTVINVKKELKFLNILLIYMKTIKILILFIFVLIVNKKIIIFNLKL